MNELEGLRKIAESRLKQIMLNSTDPKLVRQTAIDILTAQERNDEIRTPVEIRDSHVQILMTVAAELKESI